MIFKQKNKRKKTYFYSSQSNYICLYRNEYFILKDQLPLHSIEFSDDFAIIYLYCPFSNFYTYRSFYHFGERLDFTNLKGVRSFKKELTREVEVCNTNVAKDGDTPIYSNFSPCSLCKKELECMFSATQLTYTPKEYDSLYFIDTLKENGYEESKEMYNRFVKYQSDIYHKYNEFEPSTPMDYFIVFSIFIPLIVLFFPIVLLILFIDKFKMKSKKKEKDET